MSGGEFESLRAELVPMFKSDPDEAVRRLAAAFNGMDAETQQRFLRTRSFIEIAVAGADVLTTDKATEIMRAAREAK